MIEVFIVIMCILYVAQWLSLTSYMYISGNDSIIKTKSQFLVYFITPYVILWIFYLIKKFRELK